MTALSIVPITYTKNTLASRYRWMATILLLLAGLFFNDCLAQPTKRVSTKRVPTHSANKSFQFATPIKEKTPTNFANGGVMEYEANSVEERELFEYNMLKDPATGKIPRMAWKRAYDAAQLAPRYEDVPATHSPLGVITVTPKGPSNLGGRTRAIGIDIRNNLIMLAGSVSSGVFRSTDGGSSWTRVVPIGQVHNITAIAQDTRAGFEDNWYFGGGEVSGNSATLGSSYRGYGIWKSIDNGLTWTQLSSTVTATALESFDSPFDYVNRIAVDPTNGNVYAAASNTIQRSVNGGTSWTAVLGSFTNNGFTDVIVTPTGRVYAAFTGTDNNNGVWTSPDGTTWTHIAGTGAAPNHANWNAQGAYGRVVLAYAPSSTNIVFALYWNNVSFTCAAPAPEAEFFKWDQTGGTWTDLSANLPDETGCSLGNDPFAVQTGYDLSIAVKPDDVNTVFIGGTNIYRSTNGFTSTAATTRIGGYLSPAGYTLYANSHSDIHALVFGSGSNTIMYAGDDGGIQKADITIPSVTWTSLNNNYVTYQYYHTDLLPVGGSDIFVGGAQDNGTTLNTGGTTATSIFSGDGATVGFMSYTSPAVFNLIAATQSGNLVRVIAPNSAFSIAPTGSTSIFVTYSDLDQDNTNYLYYAGTNVLYRTRIATTISSTTVTANSATGWELMSGAVISGNIRSMAVSRNKTYADAPYSASNASRKLYIGTETGKVYRLDDPAFAAAATAVVDITPAGAPAAIVSSIAVNPGDDNEIMITYSNYGVNSVYQTPNANTATPTWTNVEGPLNSPVQLASARSSAIVKDAGITQYFVGTSVGLFTAVTLSGATTTWTRVGSTEINFSIVSQLRYRPSDNKILAGTHGNGMFLITLPDPYVLAIKLQSFNAEKQGDNALINWRVGLSSTAKSFEVLKSTDGRNFSTLKNMNAVANIPDYSTVDNVLVVGPNYYKLKIVDANGSISYSNIAVVYNKYKGFEITSMIPTVVTNSAMLSVATSVKANGKLIVIDAVGKLIYNQNISLLTGNNNFNLNFSNLAAGVYYIYAYSNDGKSNIMRFVKD